MLKGRNWFAKRRFGYGSGLPTVWQGWAVLIGYLMMVVALTPLASRYPTLHLIFLMTLTAVFLWICWQTTPGGWRWRWGDED